MCLSRNFILALTLCIIPALAHADDMACASITCNHVVSSSGVNLTKDQALTSFQTASAATVAEHNNAACSTWCAQQNSGACSVGTYTHHHPNGNLATCSSTTVGGGSGGGIGSVADSLLGTGGLFKKLGSASDKVKHWSCSLEYHFTCTCSKEIVGPPAPTTETNVTESGDPLLFQ